MSSQLKCLTIKVTKPNMLLLGYFIIAGLTRYQTVEQKYFVLQNAINLGIGGDENVLWQPASLPLPLPVQNIVVQCGRSNTLTNDSPGDTADCIVDVGTNTVNIIIST